MPTPPDHTPAGLAGDRSQPVGVVLGTEDSEPLEWWVALSDDSYLQLDDVVMVTSEVPGHGPLEVSGVVDRVRARHEGARFESDVFLNQRGVLPLGTARTARVKTTRFRPETYVAPLPGDTVVRVGGAERERALHVDKMTDGRLVAGLGRDGRPIVIDMSFLDGRRGAHVNISGISGVATKTSYATFLLYALFHSDVLGEARANTKALIFNVKGEDLLFLDKANARVDPDARERYARLGLPVGPFASVGIWAPARRGTGAVTADTGSRQVGVGSYFWTLADVVRDGLLRFMFAESGDERSQVADVVARVESELQREVEYPRELPALVRLPETADGDPVLVRDFEGLCNLIRKRLEPDGSRWRGDAAAGTVSAFMRRLEGARYHLGHLIRGEDAGEVDQHQVSTDAHQVTVVDIHQLHDRAKRFVVGVVVRRLLEEKERSGRADPLTFLVLDELNKYAPREGWSPIKEILLDVAERGRSLGMILIGAQQTASEVERRIVSNAAIRVAGRLDAAEAERSEYGFLSPSARGRATILQPGAMLLLQPRVPVPLEISFPFPAWATRGSEVDPRAEEGADGDPLARLDSLW